MAALSPAQLARFDQDLAIAGQSLDALVATVRAQAGTDGGAQAICNTSLALESVPEMAARAVLLAAIWRLAFGHPEPAAS